MENGVKFPVLFGLAFDVERSPIEKSGFKPAQIDLGVGKELFADLRRRGLRAALELGWAEELVIAGGDEGRYKGETPVINRAETIREMLIGDGIDSARIHAVPSRSNTGGNIAIFRQVLEKRGLEPLSCSLTTNHYHTPRAWAMALEGGLMMWAWPAEAYLIMQGMTTNELAHELGEGPLAERCAEEIQGQADMMRKTYKPRTDAAPVNLDKVVRSPA